MKPHPALWMAIFIWMPLLMGCSAAVIPSDILEKGSSALVEKGRTFQVVANQEELEDLYAQIHGNQIPQPGAPDIDWEKNYLIYLDAGRRPSSGYGLKLLSVERDDTVVKVRTSVVEPPAGQPTLAVMTRPYLLIALPRPLAAERVVFYDAEGNLLATRSFPSPRED